MTKLGLSAHERPLLALELPLQVLLSFHSSVRVAPRARELLERTIEGYPMLPLAASGLVPFALRRGYRTQSVVMRRRDAFAAFKSRRRHGKETVFFHGWGRIPLRLAMAETWANVVGHLEEALPPIPNVVAMVGRGHRERNRHVPLGP